MSKKIYAIIASLLVSTASYATEVVKLYWPFGPASASTLYRAVIDEANTTQQQHRFVMEFATGGGGIIAVNAAGSSQQPALLGHTSSFFISPITNKNATYNVNDWRMLYKICDLKFVLASAKFKTIHDIPKNTHVTVGIQGVGTTTDLIARRFFKDYTNITFVPFQNANESISAALGKHVDLILTIPGDALGHRDAGTLNVLGITGTQSVNNVPTFVSQGIDGIDELVGAYYIFVNNNIDQSLQKQWKELFNTLNRDLINLASNRLFCEPSTITIDKLDDEFIKANNFWKSMVQQH